jgi:hypothetical protein
VQSVDQRDLTNIFALTACGSLAVFAGSLVVQMDWALRFGLISAIALLNWIALAAILRGITSGPVIDVVWGIMLKPISLLGFIIAGAQGMVETSSFLLGFNGFFLTLFCYMAFRAPKGSSFRATILNTEPLQAHG